MRRDLDVARYVIVALVLGLAGVALVGALVGTGTVPIGKPSPSPSPTYDHTAFYLVQGQVFDTVTTRPISGVCLVIGPPIPCQSNFPHTGADGKFTVELPRNVTVFYDFHFVRDGYQQVDLHFPVTDDLNIPVRMEPAR